jgi:hypothetical protein
MVSQSSAIPFDSPHARIVFIQHISNIYTLVAGVPSAMPNFLQDHKIMDDVSIPGTFMAQCLCTIHL